MSLTPDLNHPEHPYSPDLGCGCVAVPRDVLVSVSDILLLVAGPVAKGRALSPDLAGQFAGIGGALAAILGTPVEDAIEFALLRRISVLSERSAAFQDKILRATARLDQAAGGGR